MDRAPTTQPSEHRSFLPLVAAVGIASVGFGAVFLLFGYLPYLFLTSAQAWAFVHAVDSRMPALLFFLCAFNMALVVSGCIFASRRQSRRSSGKAFSRLD
jgi:uncharacterized membrane protein